MSVGESGGRRRSFCRGELRSCTEITDRLGTVDQINGHGLLVEEMTQGALGKSCSNASIIIITRHFT
jgi:hypothetical protein